MLIIGLIALLTMLLGDNDLPFLLPREEKSINRVIDDKEKHKLLDFIVKGVEDKEKQYKKDKKGYTKELETLNLDRHTTTEQFSEVANNIYITNDEAFRFMIKIRLSIAQVITTDEWNLILEDSRDRFKKNVIKYEKIYPEFEKTMEKIIKRVENVISNKEDAAIIAYQMRSFSKLTLKNSKELVAINVYDHPVLSNIEATEEELLAVAPEIHKLRTEVVEEYIAIHNLLAKITTEKEWPKVVKKVNKLF